MTPTGMTFEYKILRETSFDDLEKATKDMLNKGYQLIGSLQSIHSDIDGQLFIQPMILPQMAPQAQQGVDVEPTEEDYEMLDDSIKQRIDANLATYTKDLMEVNDLHLEVEKQNVHLYKKTKDLGLISGSMLVSEIKHGKHAPNDLDESQVLQELDKAIVVGLGVSDEDL